jgi:hypothetical protein
MILKNCACAVLSVRIEYRRGSVRCVTLSRRSNGSMLTRAYANVSYASVSRALAIVQQRESTLAALTSVSAAGGGNAWLVTSHAW